MRLRTFQLEVAATVTGCLLLLVASLQAKVGMYLAIAFDFPALALVAKKRFQSMP